MRIIFMGTPDFAVKPLEAIAGSRHKVTLVVTQPDRISGRGRRMSRSAVKDCAQRLGIPVYQPVKMKDPQVLSRLLQEQPDLIVVAAYGKILPESILELPRYGCINIHGSLLPAWRGAAPIQWAVINGDAYSGITIMQMDKGLDTGDILLQQRVSLAADETAGSLYEKLSTIGGPLVLQALDQIENGTISRTPQPSEGSSYAHMLAKSDGIIDWSWPAEVIERRVRGLNPWPSAYTTYHGKQLKIWKSSLAATGEDTAGQSADLPDQKTRRQPGMVLHVGENDFTVCCGRAPGSSTQTDAADPCTALRVEEVQLEGRKRISVHDFLLGYKVVPGEILG